MVALSDPYLSVDEYLRLETKSPIKHEYIDGKVYAMAGATDSHVMIELKSIDFTGTFAELYEDVVLELTEIPDEVRIEYDV